MPTESIGFFNLIVYRCLKTFKIMANIEIRFKCKSGIGDFLTVRECENEIVIEFNELNSFLGDVCLDKSTAIKLAKTLRTEINKIQE